MKAGIKIIKLKYNKKVFFAISIFILFTYYI